jgi:hypothetical protein
MSFGDYEEILGEIAAEWGVAEEEIKLAEQIHKKVVFPAIKELRYAGRRLADALAAIARDAPQKEILDYLADARFGCHCARHDVIDASILKIAVDLDLMLKKLGHEAVLAAYPQYAELVSRVQGTQYEIAVARKKRDERRDIYQEIQKAEFPNLVREFNKVKSNEPLMKRIAGRTKFHRYLAYALGVVGILIGIAGIIIAFART